VPRFAKGFGLVGLLCSFGLAIGYYGAKAYSEQGEFLY